MTNRIAIMTDTVGWHCRRLQDALQARGMVGHCVDLSACRIDTTASWHGLQLPGFDHALPEAVIVRAVAGGTFEQVTKRLGVLHALNDLGVPVYNSPRAIEHSVDKSATSVRLHAAGIPTPPTWATESPAEAERIVVREAAAGRAVVVKPLFGSQGKGLALAGWVNGAYQALPPLATPLYGGMAYLQRYLPPVSEPGFDWRVLVIGGQAVGAMRRVSRHWVHNIAQGARAERQPLTPELAELAERATAALGLDYAGVDLMAARLGPQGPTDLQVLEVNGVAAWQGLQQVMDQPLAPLIVNDLIDRKMAQHGPAIRIARHRP